MIENHFVPANIGEYPVTGRETLARFPLFFAATGLDIDRGGHISLLESADFISVLPIIAKPQKDEGKAPPLCAMDRVNACLGAKKLINGARLKQIDSAANPFLWLLHQFWPEEIASGPLRNLNGVTQSYANHGSR
jgi:hypothetical protein